MRLSEQVIESKLLEKEHLNLLKEVDFNDDYADDSDDEAALELHTEEQDKSKLDKLRQVCCCQCNSIRFNHDTAVQ